MSLFRNNFISLPALMLAILTLLQSSPSRADENQKTDSAASANGPKIFGEFTLTTNDMNEAISDSNNSFAMQPTIGYQWLHGQIGVRGSNVQFPDNGESLELKPYAWYDVALNATIELKVSYAKDMYFKSNSRNADIFTLDVNLLGHHALVEQNSNWYGTSAFSYWFAYSNSWKVGGDIDYKLLVGYLMVDANGYSSYFGMQTGFGFKMGDFYTELLGSFNSAASQFAGTADPAIWVQLTTRF